jgi:hypothetical protein
MSRYGMKVILFFILTSFFVSACGGEDRNEILELEEGKADLTLQYRSEGQFDLVGLGLLTEARCAIGSSLCGVVEFTNRTKLNQILYIQEYYKVTQQSQWIMLLTLTPGDHIAIHIVPNFAWFGTVDSNGMERKGQVVYLHQEAPQVNFEIVDPPAESTDSRENEAFEQNS